MALQHNRIIRFLMVLTAVLLTIFIYASYYSNTVMTLPARLHASVTSSVSSLTSNKALYFNDKVNNNEILVVDKQKSRPSLQDSKTGKQLNNTINSRFSMNENGSSSSNTNLTATSGRKNSPEVFYNGTSNIAVAAPVIGAVSSIPVPPIRARNRTGQTHNDPLKGIQTGDIYESGYEYVSTSICPQKGKDLKLLIIVTSAPKNQDARLSIRQTWGHYTMRRDVAIGFSLGLTTSQQIENFVSTENSLYDDIIQGNFIDSYNNLTLKTISILEWVDTVCPKASFVLKTDDDMFINVPKLLTFIEKHKYDKRTIYGRLAKKWKPIRNQKSKYYVSPAQFPSGVFPQFTTGPAYLMTSDIISDLYTKALEQTYLKLEDVFTTGIVAQLLNIKRMHVNEFLNRRIAFNPCNIRKAISVHMIKSNEQFDLWKKLLDASAKCK